MYISYIHNNYYIVYMILLLRGHIRNSFENDDLYKVIHEMVVKYNVQIYIHTWNIQQSDISWRKLQHIPTPITNELIYTYFKNIRHNIKHIMIDDDSKIKVIGKIDGCIGKTKCPTIGWKNMWYGKYKIMDFIKSNTKNQNEMVLNMRFDILTNKNSWSFTNIMQFINQSIINNKKCSFIQKHKYQGVDNIYLAGIHNMHQLITLFYKQLDEIDSKYNNIGCQEQLVLYESQRLFGNNEIYLHLPK